MNEANTKNSSNSYMKGLKDGIPICLGYIPVSIACGISACKIGLTFGVAQLMAMMLYTASGQMAILNLIGGKETVIVMYAITLFVMNCRYLLLSMSIAQRLDPNMSTFERIIFGIFNTDEVFGVAIKEKGSLKFSYLFGLVTMPYIGYVIGNALGLFFTSLLPPSVSSALGIIIFAMFIAIIVPPAKKSKPVMIVVLTALAMSFVLECIPAITRHLSSGWMIIICAIITSVIGAVLFPVKDEEEETSGE